MVEESESDSGLEFEGAWDEECEICQKKFVANLSQTQVKRKIKQLFLNVYFFIPP